MHPITRGDTIDTTRDTITCTTRGTQEYTCTLRGIHILYTLLLVVVLVLLILRSIYTGVLRGERIHMVRGEATQLEEIL